MRAADEKKCASGTLAQQEAEKAARDSHHNNAIDLTGNDFDFNIDDFNFSNDDIAIVSDDGPSTRGPHASRPTDPSSSGPVTTRRPPDINASSKPRPPPVNSASRPATGPSWTCPTCTLINGPLVLQCDACLTTRPSQAPSSAAKAGWTCGVCGEEGMEHNLWTCRFCGSVKAESTSG